MKINEKKNFKRSFFVILFRSLPVK